MAVRSQGSCGSIMYIYITCEHTASKQDVAARNCKLEIIVHGTYNIIYTVCRIDVLCKLDLRWLGPYSNKSPHLCRRGVYDRSEKMSRP